MDLGGAPVTLTPEERRRHVYVLGATGCGKTNLVVQLIESDFRAGRSVCVVDLRGDLKRKIETILPLGNVGAIESDHEPSPNYHQYDFNIDILTVREYLLAC